MALHDLATLADALIFALLTAVSGAIAWGVFTVATRRYGFRRTTSTVSAAAVLTLALGTMAMWPAARGGTDANTGGAIPDGSAPETQRTTTPAMPTLEPAAPPSTDERFVDSAQVGRDGSQDEAPNPEPTEDAPGGSGPGDPGTTPDPPPSQSPPPDPPPSQSPPPDPPPPSPSPSPSPDDDGDDDDDEDEDEDGRRATSP